MDGYIGEKHTSIIHLKKGAPPEFQKTIEKAGKELIRKGYIVIKKTGYGDHVSLNINMLHEIEQILGIDP